VTDSRPETRPRFLIAGDATDVPQIRDMLGRLPVSAYGQVYVEVASPIQVERWSVPEGMTVTRLRRDLSSLASGVTVPRGELVRRAVAAWVDEWLPGDSEQPCVLWIGCATSPRVDDLYRDLSHRLGPESLRHPHR